MGYGAARRMTGTRRSTILGGGGAGRSTFAIHGHRAANRHERHRAGARGNRRLAPGVPLKVLMTSGYFRAVPRRRGGARQRGIPIPGQALRHSRSGKAASGGIPDGRLTPTGVQEGHARPRRQMQGDGRRPGPDRRPLQLLKAARMRSPRGAIAELDGKLTAAARPARPESRDAGDPLPVHAA